MYPPGPALPCALSAPRQPRQALVSACSSSRWRLASRRIAGADIKDKQPLMDARKSIERDMERFKELEKEAKKKGPGGGKGGMGFATDPKEEAKEKARDWINDMKDSLATQVGLSVAQPLL